MSRLWLLRMELRRIHVLCLYLHLRVILIRRLWYILHFPACQVHVLRVGGMRGWEGGMYILTWCRHGLNLWHMRLHSIHVGLQGHVLLVGGTGGRLTSLELLHPGRLEGG